MAKKSIISIIDYEVGNLRSITNSINKIGYKTKIISTPDDILLSDYLILPGVGAFEKGMQGLKKNNMNDAIIEYAKRGKPLLGICLGAQILLSKSEEFGIWKGLDLIPGRVVSFLSSIDNNSKQYYPIPQMGWNSVNFIDSEFEKSLKPYNAIELYFLHSYYMLPQNASDIAATTEYAGLEYCSIIKRQNTYGYQFHAEKSGEMGLKLLELFCTLP